MKRLTILCTLVIGVVSGFGGSPLCADDSERETLVALYHATNGPEWLNNDGWLEDGYYCGWYGVRCCEQWCEPWDAVRALELSENNLEGSLPPEIGDFQWLGQLGLADNQLRGELPEEMGLLSDLGELWLHDNLFEGPIPAPFGNLVGLRILTLSGNQLSGSIPSELENLVDIGFLYLDENNFGGAVPEGLWKLPNLEFLGLSNNRLEGAIPPGAVFNWSMGYSLGSNQFLGRLPRGLLAVSFTWGFGIDYNAFHTDDPEIIDQLAWLGAGDWRSTQTLAPDTVVLAETDESTLRLEWSGGGPADLPGHTIVEHALSGDEWTDIGTTDSRDVSTFDLPKPADSLSHHYRLRTVTDSHENNKNTVTSDPSRVVTFNSAGHRVIPAVARIRGNGAFFTSTVHVFNPGSIDLEMHLTYTPRSDIEGEPRTTTWALPAGQAETIDDCLEHFFGPWGDEGAVGSLLISITSGLADDLLLQSIITARHDTGEEYGQFFPASNFSRNLQAGQIGHIHTTVDADHSRVNSGFTALEPDTNAACRLVDPIGMPVSDAVHFFEGGAGASTQLNDVWQIFGVDPVSDALVEVAVQQGSLLTFGSILDGHGDYEGTSDPTTLAPFTQGREIVTLLEMGDIVGHNEYSGSASITNTTDQEITVTAEFHQRGWQGVAAETTFDLDPGETQGFSNVSHDLFGLEGVVGTITLETNANALVASGREFAVHRDDDGKITGTSGQLIRGLATEDLLEPETAWHVIGLRQDSRPKGHRTNFAAFNPASADVTITVELFDQGTGVTEGSTEYIVRGQELIHVNGVISEINPEHDERDKRLLIRVTGPIYLQAFKVNPSGDPVTIDALPHRE